MLRFLVALILTLHRDERGWNPLPDFKGILNGIADLFDKIRGFVGDAVDFVHYFLQVIANKLTDMASTIGDLLRWFGTIAVNTVRDGVGAIRDVFTWFGQLFVNTVTAIGGTISDLFTWFGQQLVNVASAFGGTVKDLFTWFATQLVNVATGIGGMIKDVFVWSATQLVNGVRDTVGHLADVWTFVGGGIINGITSTGGKLVDIATWFGTHLVNSVGEVKDAVDTVGEKAIKAGIDHKDEILGALLAGVPIEIIVEKLGGWEKVGGEILGALRIAGDDAKSFGGNAFNTALDAFIGTGHIEPGDAPAQIAQALAIATSAGLAAQVPGLVQGLLPFENATATTHLAGFLGKFSGWDILIEAGLGGAVALGLKRPIEQHINKQTTTNIPSERDLDELVARRKIEPPTYDEGHSRHGYSGVWTQVLQDAAYRPPRVFELARIMQFVDLPDDQLTAALNDGGYRDEFIKLLVPALHGVANKTSSQKLLNDATAAYSDGFIDAEAFGAVCTKAGIAPGEQGLLVFAAEMAYQVKVKTELLTAYRARAAADALSDEELRAGLSGIGVTGRKADVEVARANIARKKKPVGNTDAAHTKALNATVATLTTAYKLQFRKGLIDEAQLFDHLVFIGIPDFQASAIVELTKVEALKAPSPARGNTPAEVAARVRKDLEAAYITQFLHGAIDEGQLHAQLVAVGVDATEADAIVAREAARKVPKPSTAHKTTADVVAKQVQDTLAKAYEEQFTKGLISADELEQDLVAIGIDPRVALARRLLFEAKATKKAPPPAP